MTPSRPYLLRAFYDWIVDNNLTPYIVLDADFPGMVVPKEYVSDGRIVLNIAPEVVNGLALGNDNLEFKARFGGVPRHIYAPIGGVMAIYAKENGQGTVFGEDDIAGESGGEGGEQPDPPDNKPPTKPATRNRPNLKIVK